MGHMDTFYTFFWKLKMMTKLRIQLKYGAIWMMEERF